MTRMNTLLVVAAYLCLAAFKAPASFCRVLELKDMEGNKVELQLPIKRVAVHYPHILEVIKALGAKEVVVAVPDNVSTGQWKTLEDFRGMKAIGSGAGPGANINLEVLLASRAEILLAHPLTAKALELSQRLKPFGIPVIGVDITTLDTLYQNILLLGTMLGKEKEANSLVAFIDKYLKLVDNRLKDLAPGRRQKVYLEFFTDYYTCVKGFTGDPVTRRAGGINVAADLSAAQVSSEWVIKKDPEVIIKSQLPTYAASGLGVADPSAMERLRLAIMSRPGWQTIKAVKEGKVYVFNSDLWTSPRVWLGVLYTAKILYPERFQDLYPDKVHEEYLTKFLGIKGNGIWCWPPPGR